MLALFVALGGAAYAGTTISGSSIKNGSIGGGKLKNETITAGKLKKGTITGAQIAPGSISSTSIDLSTLGTVPSAQTANTAGTATKADSATTATSATTADMAKTAETAKSAESAENAKHAETADSATHADVADQVIHAENSDTATHADTAGEAETLDGKTAEELTLSCQSGTEFYGGMCWDETTRNPKLWPVAAHECGEAGGRLPSIEELIAFVLRDGSQFSGEAWSGDLDSIETNPPSKVEVVFTTDEVGLARTRSAAASLLGYRCVFSQSN